MFDLQNILLESVSTNSFKLKKLINYDSVLSSETRLLRHLSEQYFTSSQHFAHFLRQVKGRSHTGQILVGRSDFER